MMVHDTRPTWKALVQGVPAAASPDAPRLRSVNSSPSSMRKSERRGKPALEARPSKRKAEEFEKQSEPVSLEKSERGKMQSLSSSSGSKKSDGRLDFSVPKRKHVKEKSVSQLNSETKPIKTGRKRVASRKGAEKRLNARAYRALFEWQNKVDLTGHCDEVGNSAELSQQSCFGSRGDTSENFDNDDELSQTSLAEANAKGEQLAINSGRTPEESIENVQENTTTQIADENKETSDCASRDGVKIKDVNVEQLNEKNIGTLRGPESTCKFQRDCIENLCSICKLGGNLMYCDGKGCQTRSHLACLNYHEEDFIFGVWHCYSCVKKKILFGVHAVSKGMESIWKSKEVEVFDGNDLEGKKHYLVKYKSLAHLHNRWVPDREVLNEAPSLVEKFNEENQSTRWKGQWAMPRRLSRKRSVASFRQSDDPACDIEEGHFEWLVKWLGLGYEHATWELENAFINSLYGKRVVIEYEKRKERLKTSQYSHGAEKEVGMEIGPLIRMSSHFDDSHLEFINNLCEQWDKRQSFIVIDDQERMTKVVSFISSLTHVLWPFLIISTSNALHSWDEEFFVLAPSVDVVVYHGDKDTRKGIRMVEFCEERCFMMSHVIVTSAEVMSEDLDIFASTKWAAIFVDEYEFSGMYEHLAQIKELSSNMVLLLVNGKLKDERIEHLLSLFDYQSDMILHRGSVTNSSPRIGSLKERFSKYIANGCNLDSRFLEYWVSAGISGIQLEQYCANLLSNSLMLCSPSKKDTVGSLHHILGDARKCCDHPYLVDQLLQASLVKEVKELEILDVGIKASGKLQLLDMMLSEIKSRSLRVVILFQTSVVPGKINIGDILDDLVRQRYGNDSYERCDGLLALSKRQAAVHKFNNLEGRFIFLLETRACGPTIKLSLVDCVILFGSDWSPMNDIRNLQRLTLDSKSEKIKVFRLYSSFTVEEKALILGRQDSTFDCKVQNLNSTACHLLLMWGASILFEKLAEFHSHSTVASNGDVLFEQLRPESIIQEFAAILDQNGKDDKTGNSSVIVKVQASEVYSGDASLPGELEIRPMDEEIPHLFWKKLLDEKQPLWRYPSSFQSQRKRKRVPSSKNDLQVSGDGGLKKQKKVAANNSHVPILENPSIQENVIGNSGHLTLDQSASPPRSFKPGPSDNSSEVPEAKTDGFNERINFHELQKSLHWILKPEIVKLSEVLRLPENVKDMVEGFLDYFISNHTVPQEPATLLQAFQLSLCWTAASSLKYKLDQKESLLLARQHLNFTCKKKEADYVYSKVRCLKSLFLYRTGRLGVAGSPSTPHISSEELSKDVACARSSHPSQANIAKHAVIEPHLGLAQKDFKKSIQDIEKKCAKQMKKLLEKQQKERKVIQSSYDAEKSQLENKKRTETAVIRLLKGSMMMNQLRLLEDKHAETFNKLKSQTETRLRHLEERHVAARDQLLERKSNWIEGVKSWAQVELVNTHPEEDQENAPSQKSCPKNQISEGPSSKDGQKPPEYLYEGCTTTSGAPAPAQLDDAEDSRHQCRLSSVPSSNYAEINQPDTTTSITNQEAHLSVDSFRNDKSPSGDVEALQREQQNDNVNCQSSAQTSVATLQFGEAPLEEVETAAMPVVGDNLPGTENLGVSFVSSSDATPLEVCEASPVLPEITTDVIVGDITGRENNGASFVQLHCSSRCDEQAGVVPSQAPETSNELEEGGCNVRRAGEASPISPGRVTGSNQRGELPSDCNQNRELSQKNLPPVQPVAASAEENSMSSSQALLEEHNQPLQEGCDLGTSTHLPEEVMETPMEPSRQSVLQLISSFSEQLPAGSAIDQPDLQVSDTRTGLNAEIGNPSAQAAATVRMPATKSQDPLQNELEIIMKEKEETMKNLETMKFQLKSDCEKEIEEEVAKIRRKYEVKLKETESIFLLKKKGLDENLQKVLMNKMLAEALRSKWTDIKAGASNSFRTQQGMASNLTHQRHLASSPSASVRAPAALSPADTGSIQTPIAPGHRASPTRSTISPQQVAHPFLVPSSGRPATPPCISSLPSMGNLQASSQISVPPHLQHLRPLAPVSVASPAILGGMPNQQVLGTATPTSMLPSLPPPYGSRDMANRLHGISGNVPPASNSSFNTREFMDLENPTSGSRVPPANLPSATTLTPNLAALQLNIHTAPVNPPQDVVCLSDDD